MRRGEFVTKVTERLSSVVDDEGKAKSVVLGKRKADTKAIIEAIEVEVINAIKSNEEVPFAFGRIGGKTKESRSCRNPMTGETVIVPTKVGYPYIKFNSTLKK